MTPSQFDLPALGGAQGFQALTEAVRSAGDLARRMFETRSAPVERKQDDSPVTAADRAVEAQLVEFVREHYPSASFYGEETGENIGTGNLRFVVDPIDGTRAFMRGWETWSVLVGIEEAGELIAALAYLPATGELYRAQRGRGAWLGDRRLEVSKCEDLATALVCHGGLGQFASDNLLSLLPALATSTYTQRCPGDFAGYASLLKGEADLVIDPAIQPYDVAPAALLVQEAGGRFTDLAGQPTVYGRGALATNGALHDPSLALIREHL